MMMIFFGIYILLCLLAMRVRIKGNTEYLSVETTQILKGIFILLVFFSHFNAYVSFDGKYDSVYRNIVLLFGQTMVTLFLFYSGYGVMESYKKKGMDYVEQMPRKRVLSTLFKFDCAVVIFWLIGIASGATYGLKQIVLSLIGWESLGNSNWYIFVILLLYLITYIVFKLIKGKHPLWSVGVIGFVVVAMIGSCIYWHIKPSYWYDTALCYVLGMAYSLLKEKIEKVINRNIITWILWMVLLSAVCVYLKMNPFAHSALILNLLFAMAVVVFTMRIGFKSKILKWFGANLFEVYILQRIPMIIFREIGLGEYNIYLYFIVCLVVTLLIVIPFHKITDKLWMKISKSHK